MQYKFTNKKNNIFLLITFAFFVLLFFNATVFFESFKKYIHISTSMLAFPVYYQYFKNRPSHFKKFILRIIQYNIIFITSIVISSVFKLGTSWGYGANNAIYLVGINIWALYGIIYPVILSLLISEMYNFKKYIKVNQILLFVLMVILLLIFKRMLLLTFLIGCFMYFYAITAIDKKNVVSLLFVVLIMMFLYQIYGDIINQVVHYRNRIYEIGNYTQEGRYLEFLNYFKYWLNEESLRTIFLGVDFFYSGRTDNFDAVNAISIGRIIHSDLANFLYTTGLIGTILFIVYLVQFFKSIIIFKKHSVLANYIFTFMLVTVILNIFSEGIDNTLNYYMFLSITGALAGHMTSIKNVGDY